MPRIPNANECFENAMNKRLKKTSLFLIMCLLPFGSIHAGWELSWIERFDDEGLNLKNWTPQIQAAFNNEIQCYTDDESSAQRNFEVSDGTLKITARRQNINCPGQNGRNRDWTSGRLNSKDKAEFLYGRLEARIRFSELKRGTWPAFWMLENRIAEDPFKGDNDNINWPNPGAGEIDVWEWYSNSGDSYITNFFNTGSGSSCGREQRIPYPGGSPDVMAFQTYGLEWTADEILFFMNDNVVVRHDLTNCSQYEEPMFVLLNVAMGGTLGGTVDSTLNAATMEVDYVAHCVATDTNGLQECNESTPFGLDDDSDGVINSLDQCSNTPANAEVDSVGCQIVAEPEPQEIAPVPTQQSDAVISIFSDSFNNIDGVNFNPNWGQATQVTQEQVQGDNVLKYTNLNFQGTDFGGNAQDVSAMDTLYIDYWTPNSTSLKIYLISPGPSETSFEVEVVQQAWQSLAIPLSTYAGVVDLSDVFQLKVEGIGTVYLDNIFFGTEAAAPTPTPTPTPTPPAPTPVAESSGGSMPVSMLIGFVLVLLSRSLRTRTIRSHAWAALRARLLIKSN